MTYVDAVELGALSAFAHFGVVERNASDLDAMAKLFAFPESHIYDSKNSFVVAGLPVGRHDDALVPGQRLDRALADQHHRGPARHRSAPRPLQSPCSRRCSPSCGPPKQPGGYWTANVDHPSDFPAPESSGTSFFTYGMAKGIQAGYLDAAAYTPVVRAAWQWLRTTALHADGVVGYVQGPSSQPSQHQPISPNATTNYGVGAFLLAGVEASKLTPGC